MRDTASPTRTLIETLAGLAAANVVMVETLHEHQVSTRRTSRTPSRARSTALAPEHRGGMIEHVLRNLRDRCMNLRRAARPTRRHG